MIQANEAVVGRWFSRKHGKGHTWTQLDEKIVGLIFSDSTGYALDDFDPIPLTPEILEKAGFVKVSIHNPFFNIYDIALPRDRQLSVSEAGTPNEIIFINDKKSGFELVSIPVRNYDYDGKTFLHQLQNLYFALTLQELTINL